MHLNLIILLSILVIGCSSIKVVEKTVEVPIYIDRQDTLVLKDSVTSIDTFWYSDIVDSLQGVIGNLKVWYKKKLAELNIKQMDTVYVAVYDTLRIEKEKPITVISGLLPLWAEIVLIIIGIFLLWFTQKSKITR